MGYRGIVSIWDNHYEDFKQLTTWRRGDDGPMSPTSEVWYDILDEELQAGIIFFIRLLLSVSPWLPFYVQLANDAPYVRTRLDYPPGRPTFPSIF